MKNALGLSNLSLLFVVDWENLTCGGCQSVFSVL